MLTFTEKTDRIEENNAETAVNVDKVVQQLPGLLTKDAIKIVQLAILTERTVNLNFSFRPPAGDLGVSYVSQYF